MKKFLLTAFLAFVGSWVFAQERIAVFPFEILDKAVTLNESFQLYRTFSNEFTNRSAGKFSVVPRQDVERLINTEAAFQLSDFSARTKTAEMQKVLNGTQILSGTIGKMGNSITIIVSLYTYPDLQQLPGGASSRANTAVELFDKIPELVRNMQNEISGGTTGPAQATVKDHLDRGDSYMKQDDYALAIAEYTQAIRLDANNFQAYNNRGQAYYYLGNSDRAIADFNQAIRLRPNSSVLFYNRGSVYADNENYNQAIADFSQSINLNPNYAKAYIKRGKIYATSLFNSTTAQYSLIDSGKAIADFTQAINLDQNDPEVYLFRGQVFFWEKEYNRAISDLTQAIRLNSNYVAAYVQRAYVYSARDDYTQAITDLESALRIDPNNIESRWWRHEIEDYRQKRGW